MLNRRTFLQASLALGALPSLTARALAGQASVYTVVDGRCSDTRRFVMQCPDAPETLTEPLTLVAALARDAAQTCFGLGRDSNFFIIEQLAGALGYRLGYHGVHDYRDGGLRHRLTGAPAVVDRLGKVFTVAGDEWPAQLADAVPVLALASTRKAIAEVRAGSPRPLDSTGYLVSWCLHRA